MAQITKDAAYDAADPHDFPADRNQERRSLLIPREIRQHELRVVGMSIGEILGDRIEEFPLSACAQVTYEQRRAMPIALCRRFIERSGEG